MTWHDLVHHLGADSYDTGLLDESVIEYQLEETTFLLQHDETTGGITALGWLGALPPKDTIESTELLALLQENLHLQAADAGTLAIDSEEQEIIWKKHGISDLESPEVCVALLQQIHTLRGELSARLPSLWPLPDTLAPDLDALEAELLHA